MHPDEELSNKQPDEEIQMRDTCTTQYAQWFGRYAVKFPGMDNEGQRDEHDTEEKPAHLEQSHRQ